MKEHIQLGKWTENELDDLLKESPSFNNPGKRIDFLSKQFLRVIYRESTLTGGADTPEVFVINLAKVDCFTFLDYIEAMRSSGSFAAFRDNLKKVRYQSGRVAYESRNHFFTDWLEFNPDLVHDVTAKISSGKNRRVSKSLNMKDDGTLFLASVPVRDREIVYVPSESVDDPLIGNLITGDYIGIYSEKAGLDVSHVGIFIRKEDAICLRHASSAGKNKRVVDEDFREYIADKPGIIVLRAK